MSFFIISSKKDPAGVNIYNTLLEKYDFEDSGEEFRGNIIYQLENKRLVLVDEETLDCNDIDKELKAEHFIFATRHQSVEKKPCLTCHVPGNWNEAEYGGKNRELCIAPCNLLKMAYLEIKTHNNLEGFETSLEATHHGPFLSEKPCIFIEIGSSKEEWNNKEAANIIAKVIMIITSTPIPQEPSVVGLGGPHYCNNFNKLLERSDYAIGHVCPKYMLEKLDEELLKKSIERTFESTNLIILDWKGLGKEKHRIIELIEKLEIKSERIKNLL